MNVTRFPIAAVLLGGVLALALLLGGGGRVQAGSEKKPQKDLPSFSQLQSPTPEVARGQALAWLKRVGMIDAATQKAFDELWASDRPLLDKVSGTLALGDPAAARLLQEARDPDTAAPTRVPDLIKDQKLPRFFRANLG